MMLTVAALGLSEKEQETLRTVLDVAAGLEIGRWQLADYSQPAAVIFTNADAPVFSDWIDEIMAMDSGAIFVRCTAKGVEESSDDPQITLPLNYRTVVSLLRDFEGKLHRVRRSDGEQPITAEALTALFRRKPYEMPTTIDDELKAELVAESLDIVDSDEDELDVDSTQNQDKEAPKLTIVDPNPGKTDYDVANLPTLKEVYVADDSTALADGDVVEVPLLETVTPEEKSAQIVALDVPLSQEISWRKHTYLPRRGLFDERKKPQQEKPAMEMMQVLKRPAMRFYRYTRLLGLLHSIFDKNKSVIVTHPTLPTLVVSPERGVFGSVDPLDSELELFSMPAYKFQVQEVSSVDLDEVMADYIIQPLWALFYSAALFGAEGRLMETMVASDVLRLERMPDFKRVPHCKEHLKLAKYLVSHSADIIGLAQITRTPLPMVIDFCNACEEAELIKCHVAVRKIPRKLSGSRGYSKGKLV